MAAFARPRAAVRRALAGVTAEHRGAAVGVPAAHRERGAGEEEPCLAGFWHSSTCTPAGLDLAGLETMGREITRK